MSGPQDFTLYQATDPGTAPETLSAMAAQRPDLRQFVAANPATPPVVLQWLGTLADPAVRAALARRPGGAPLPPSGQPTYGLTAPGLDAVPGPHTAPGQVSVPYGEPNPSGGDTGRAGRSADPYPGPADPYSGAPGPYPGPADPYSGAPGPYPGPGGPYGVPPPWDAPQPRRRAWAIVAAVVGGLVVLLVIGGIAVVALTSLGPQAYGDDAELDRLWDACAQGDGVACDELYRNSPPGSEYEEFGDTCGYRYEPSTVWCESAL